MRVEWDSEEEPASLILVEYVELRKLCDVAGCGRRLTMTMTIIRLDCFISRGPRMNMSGTSPIMFRETGICSSDTISLL